MSEPRSSATHAGRTQLSAYLADFDFRENVRDLHRNVRGDVMAGITVALVVLPMALAFGVTSGLGAGAGLWAAIAAGLVAGPLSGFAWSVGGPTGPMTIQLLAILAQYPLANGKPDLALATAAVIMGGLMLVGLGVLKLGTFIRYTPYSVISGFMTGLGAIYMILQINPLFGLPSASSIREATLALPSLLHDMNADAAVVGGLALFAMLAWGRWVRISWLPSPLIGLTVGILVAAVPSVHVPMVHAVPLGLPDLHVPDASVFSRALIPGATLAALCVFDSLLTALIVDNLTSTRHNSDRELVAQGAANIASGLLGGIGSATNTMPCVVAVKSGAQTRLATLVMGLTLLALALGCGPLASYVPMPALAAILAKAGWDIIDLRVLPVVRALPRSDLLTFGLVVTATVAWSLLPAMALGLAVAFFRFVKDSADRYQKVLDERASEHQREHERLVDRVLGTCSADRLRVFSAEAGAQDADDTKQRVALGSTLRERLQVVRPHGPLFFGAVSWLQETVSNLQGKDVLLVDCAELDSVDLSGAYALADLVDAAHREGLLVVVSGMQPTTRKVLEGLHELEQLPEDCRFATFEEALDRAVEELTLRLERRQRAATHDSKETSAALLATA